jgi:hypothetical protein
MTTANEKTPDPVSSAGHEDTWGATEEFKAAWTDAHPAPQATDEGPGPAQSQSQPGPTYKTPNA